MNSRTSEFCDMKTQSNTQPRAAGEAAHTPTLGIFIPSGTIEGFPEYDSAGKIARYRCDVSDLGGGDRFYTYGMSAKEAEDRARKIVRTLERGNPNTNGHAALVEALTNLCAAAEDTLCKAPPAVGLFAQALRAQSRFIDAARAALAKGGGK